MKISVCSPSYKRPKVKTLEYLPFCRIYVDPKEYAKYKKENPTADIVTCKTGIQGNVARVRNHILDREFAAGADAVVIVDDDMTSMGYYENGTDKKRLATEDFLPFVEKYTVMAQDMGVKLWGVNVNFDPQCYRTCTPFSTLSFIGGPFGCFLKGNICRYDETLPLKEDYDMTIQQIRQYRAVLRINKYHYIVKQSKQSGGCASMRNLETEKEQLLLLQKKWGKKIVKFDTIDRNHKTKKYRTASFDYNPVIHIPIKGI